MENISAKEKATVVSSLLCLIFFFSSDPLPLVLRDGWLLWQAGKREKSKVIRKDT